MAQIKESKNEKIKYKVFSIRLHEETVKSLKLLKIQSGKSWNRFIFNLLSQTNMGLLDPLPERVVFVPGKEKPSIELNCEKCGSKFMGYPWMVKSRKQITCTQCFNHSKFEEWDEK